MRVAHGRELKAANDRKNALEKRIQVLESEKVSLENDLSVKDDTIRQTIAKSEWIEQECSLLKEQHNVSSNDMFNEETDGTDGHETVGMDLQEAHKANKLLKIALSNAQRQALFFETRMLDLNHALNQTPDQVAGVKAMIEAKDVMFSNLEAKAGECFMASIALEKNSRREHEWAESKIAELEKQLKQSAALITKLADSKAVFQQQAVDVFAMLRAKIVPTDFVRAMDDHFSLVIRDNSFLRSTILEQTQELSSKAFETTSLNAKVLEINKLLEEKEERCSILETKFREKDNQVDRLELEMNALSSENEQDSTRNNTIIADMEMRLRAAYAYLDESRDERERELFRSQDSEIFQLKENCKQHSQANHELEGLVHSQEETIKDYTAEVSMAHSRVTEISAELEATKAKFSTLEDETRAQLGLPATVSILEVLSQKKELDATRRDCINLEEELQTAPVDAEKRRAELNGANEQNKQSERCSLEMRDVGLELLARLRRARGAPVELRLTETDEELEQKLRMLWDAFA